MIRKMINKNMSLIEYLYSAVLSIIFCVIFIYSADTYAQNRNPFEPYKVSEPQVVVINEDGEEEHVQEKIITDPLLAQILTDYRVIGTIISPSTSIAIVQTPLTNRDYFMHIGDMLGIEGGVIQAIHLDGINVDVKGTIISLNVSNKIDGEDE